MKDRMGRSEAAYYKAQQIGLDSGALMLCRACGDEVCQNELSPDSALELGATLFQRGDIDGFGSQQELDEEIKAAFNEAYDGMPGMCPRCEHNLHDD